MRIQLYLTASVLLLVAAAVLAIPTNTKAKGGAAARTSRKVGLTYNNLH